MNHSTAMELIREANPVPNPAGMERPREGISGRIGKLVLGVVAALVIGAGAAWAATGQSPIDLFTEELTDQGAPPSFIESVEKDAESAPAGTLPGPVPESDEIHLPQGAVAGSIVEFCKKQADSGTNLAGQNPHCAAVLLKDAGVIQGGVYESDHIENRYENWSERQ